MPRKTPFPREHRVVKAPALRVELWLHLASPRSLAVADREPFGDHNVSTGLNGSNFRRCQRSNCFEHKQAGRVSNSRPALTKGRQGPHGPQRLYPLRASQKPGTLRPLFPRGQYRQAVPDRRSHGESGASRRQGVLSRGARRAAATCAALILFAAPASAATITNPDGSIAVRQQAQLDRSRIPLPDSLSLILVERFVSDKVAGESFPDGTVRLGNLADGGTLLHEAFHVADHRYEDVPRWIGMRNLYKRIRHIPADYPWWGKGAYSDTPAEHAANDYEACARLTDRQWRMWTSDDPEFMRTCRLFVRWLKPYQND